MESAPHLSDNHIAVKGLLLTAFAFYNQNTDFAGGPEVYLYGECNAFGSAGSVLGRNGSSRQYCPTFTMFCSCRACSASLEPTKLGNYDFGQDAEYTSEFIPPRAGGSVKSSCLFFDFAGAEVKASTGSAPIDAPAFFFYSVAAGLLSRYNVPHSNAAATKNNFAGGCGRLFSTGRKNTTHSPAYFFADGPEVCLYGERITTGSVRLLFKGRTKVRHYNFGAGMEVALRGVTRHCLPRNYLGRIRRSTSTGSVVLCPPPYQGD